MCSEDVNKDIEQGISGHEDRGTYQIREGLKWKIREDQQEYKSKWRSLLNITQQSQDFDIHNELWRRKRGQYSWSKKLASAASENCCRIVSLQGGFCRRERVQFNEEGVAQTLEEAGGFKELQSVMRELRGRICTHLVTWIGVLYVSI